MPVRNMNTIDDRGPLIVDDAFQEDLLVAPAIQSHATRSCRSNVRIRKLKENKISASLTHGAPQLFDHYATKENELFQQKQVRRRLKSGKKPARELPEWDPSGPTSIFKATTVKKTKPKPVLSLNNHRLNDRMHSAARHAGRRNVFYS